VAIPPALIAGSILARAVAEDAMTTDFAASESFHGVRDFEISIV
jgi:hypothetical protein